MQEEAEEGEIDFSAPMVKFPRRNEKDPYKRLGLTADSSFEEVQEARNFLVKEYMRDVDGCEQIDLAMDAILKEKLNTRKKSKGLKRKNLRQKKEEEDYTPPFVQRVKNQFEKPDKTTLMRRAVLFFGISIRTITITIRCCTFFVNICKCINICPFAFNTLFSVKFFFSFTLIFNEVREKIIY